jgi:RimJ/RimL family protein N-acetyltransferase
MSNAPVPTGEMRRPRRSLAGRFVALRPPRPGVDAAALYPGSHGSPEREAVWDHMGYGPFRDLEALEETMEAWAASEDPAWLTVTRTEDATPVGVAAYLNLDTTHRRVEIGHIWYVLHAQRTAANTEATYLMAEEAFACGARRVEWKCDARNERSRAAAVRLGFAFEGVFRKHMIVKGLNRDTAWYSLTDDGWHQVAPIISEWLYERGDEEPPFSLAVEMERRR